MDEKALVRVLVAERVKVLDFIVSLVRRQDLAEEVYQDVCMLAVQKRKSISGDLHLIKWMRTTSRLVAMNLLRKQHREHLTLDAGVIDMLEAEWTQEDKADGPSLVEAIRACLGRLSPKARALVDWRYMQGLSYGELSKKLNRPVASLYTAFGRIHALLGECVSERVGQEGVPRA